MRKNIELLKFNGSVTGYLFAGQNMLKYLTHKLRTQSINEDNSVQEKVCSFSMWNNNLL